MLAAASLSDQYYDRGLLGSGLGGCGWSRCVHCTDTPGGPVVPCGPQHQKCIAKDKPKYTFHLADPTCDINDPNGPMYDPVHGVYHNFYQIHIAEDADGAGDGPDWGHWVSKDMLHWAQLPVAIWNDRYYDNRAIYTGSTTIVNGKPVMMYPGLCKKPGLDGVTCNDGQGGFTYVLITPKNASDPLYVEWTKEGDIDGKKYSNPVVNSTGDDPSTAWKTKDDEWRIIGNQGCHPENGNPMYGSMDFVNWYKVGCTTMMAGDCPSFFPLPALTPGSEHYVAKHLKDAPMPDHVHKSGGPGGDQTQVGNWVDGKPGPVGTGTVGNWTLTAGSTTQLLDKGKTHASKDFHDPIGKRQIMWVWGTTVSGIQTIPRDMTYHPGLKRLNYAPIAEMVKLRSKTALDHVVNAAVGTDNKTQAIQITSASEVLLTFAMPTSATTIKVGTEGHESFIVFTPPSADIAASINPTTGTGDPWGVSVGVCSSASQCKPMDTLMLLPDDKTLTLRMFYDGHVVETYFQGGRVVLTTDGVADPGGVGAATVSASSSVMLAEATSYTLSDIHTTVEDVLATPRREQL